MSMEEGNRAHLRDGLIKSDIYGSVSWMGYALIDRTIRLMTGKPFLGAYVMPLRLVTDAMVKNRNLMSEPAIFGTGHIAKFKAVWGVR
jgi:hypothetical protein